MTNKESKVFIEYIEAIITIKEKNLLWTFCGNIEMYNGSWVKADMFSNPETLLEFVKKNYKFIKRVSDLYVMYKVMHKESYWLTSMYYRAFKSQKYVSNLRNTLQ